jgi:hypothetical protein
VLEYDPPRRFVISWDISPQWQLETDPEKTSEVEVRFLAQGPSRTRVELEHRNLERHGGGWDGVRDAVASPGGWPAGLQAFAAFHRDRGRRSRHGSALGKRSRRRRTAACFPARS